MSRSQTITWAGILLWVTLVADTAGSMAIACSCATIGEPNAASYKVQYDTIFVGIPVLIASDSHSAADGTLEIRGAWIRFRVTRAWKGASTPFLWVHTGVLGGGGCGIDFQLNGVYLVFASRVGEALDTNACDPTDETSVVGVLLNELGSPQHTYPYGPDPLVLDHGASPR
jgi:hypothetical protein